ncbi:MAG: prenyltransferase/squalene oxidase repeat-containing protein [Planctomycetota bacterium]
MRRALPRRPFTTAALAAASLTLVVGVGIDRSFAEDVAVEPVPTTPPAATPDVIGDRSGAATAEMIRRSIAIEPPAQPNPDGNADEPTPEEIAAARTQAVDWLLAHQNNDGGWGQGEESRHMQRAGGQEANRDPSNVGDTAASVLALLRVEGDGFDQIGMRFTERTLKAHQAIKAGLDYLLTAVETHESNDLYITDLRGTRLQGKLGPFVGTFLTAVTLTEALGHNPGDERRERITAALERIVDKIEANQQANGGFGGGGWANALSVSLSNRALNESSRLGIEVDDTVLARSQQAAAGSDVVVGDRFAARGDAAGIELYAAAKAVSGTAANDVALRESVVVAAPQLAQVAQQAEKVADELERDGEADKAEEIRRASRELVIVTEGEALDGDIAGRQAAAAGELNAMLFRSEDGRRRYARVAGADAAPASAVADSLDSFGLANGRFNDNAEALAQTRGVVLQRLSDQQFVAGFGSDGGEEYLSYMKIGEGLAGDADAQEAFTHFVKAMKGNLTRVQNQDGSWTGHHCITGRNFCTATALMVMTLDEWAVEKG